MFMHEGYRTSTAHCPLSEAKIRANAEVISHGSSSSLKTETRLAHCPASLTTTTHRLPRLLNSLHGLTLPTTCSPLRPHVHHDEHDRRHSNTQSTENGVGPANVDGFYDNVDDGYHSRTEPAPDEVVLTSQVSFVFGLRRV